MKRIILAGLLLVGLVGFSEAGRRSGGYGTGSNPRSTQVGGYTKKDGTYVAPYQRTMPNSRKSDNYSTKGNQNPWTGKTGTDPLDAGEQ